MEDKTSIKTEKSSVSPQADNNDSFNKATKIGVFRELHGRGLISEQELSLLIKQTRSTQIE